MLAAGVLLWSSMAVGDVSGQSPNADVALAPFAVAGDKANELRPVADDCLGQLATALAGKGVKVSRLPSLDDKTLERAKPARWAVLGKVERKKDMISAELRLMDVAAGEEMRSYFHTSADPKEIAALGARAADRIAAFVKDQPPRPYARTKSMKPRSASAATSFTRTRSPTSSPASPWTTRPSTGGASTRTHVPLSDAPVTIASKT